MRRLSRLSEGRIPLPHALSTVNASSQDESQALHLLALACVKGLGDEGIARILAQLHGRACHLNEFFQASPEFLRREYHLRIQAARTISHEQESLLEDAGRLADRARDLDVVILAPWDPTYPSRIAPMYQGEPPLLYARGNLALLNTPCTAVLNSAHPSPQALENTLGLARRLAEAGHTLLASPEGASHNLVGTAARLAEGRVIIVLHQGMFTTFNGHPERDPLPLSRRLDQPLDFDRTLFLSPFRLEGRWQKGNGPRRDMLLAALAQTVVVVHLRPGGNIDTLCRDALVNCKRVFVCHQAPPDKGDAVEAALIDAGATALVGDPAGSSVDLVLNRPAPILTTAPDSDELERRRALGQFFTPPEVAAFIWDMVGLLGGRKLARTARVIDPACGEGVFLRVAAGRGKLAPAQLVGVDLDDTLTPAWRDDPILRHAHMFRTNGLRDNASIGLVPGSFDLVIGNPPFGGQGLKGLLRLLESPAQPATAQALFSEQGPPIAGATTAQVPRHERAILDQTARQLSRYVCWRLQRDTEEESERFDSDTGNADGLFGGLSFSSDRALQATDYDRMAELMSDWPANRPLDLASSEMRQAIRRLASTAIEVFFTERFIQLAKPGGLIAVIVPESILASDQLSALRAWLLGHTQLLAVVSLPQKVFTGVGANAKTGIILARPLTAAEQRATDRTRDLGMGCRILPKLLKSEVLLISPNLDARDAIGLDEYLATIHQRVAELCRARHRKGASRDD
jgi:predicted Rossmann fold nucleotide-binding protein DprA/Smf involved in DNA uptake